MYTAFKKYENHCIILTSILLKRKSMILKEFFISWCLTIKIKITFFLKKFFTLCISYPTTKNNPKSVVLEPGVRKKSSVSE